MARVAMESFEEGEEIVRVYLAVSLAEARRVEEALDRSEFSYAVEVEPFASPTALGSNAARSGAGFWVLSEDLEACADALEQAGLIAGLVQR